MLVKVGEGNLLLEAETAAKYQLLKQRVYNITKKWIFITQPYGANRTGEEQAYLRNGWDKKLPGFYYAAPRGQSNHEDGRAFDINNWAAVGESVIKTEAEKLGLKRDPNERWHWNNTGPSLAALGITPLENDMSLTDREHVMLTRINDFWTRGEPLMHGDGEGLRTLWDTQANVKDGRAEMNQLRDQISDLVKAGGFLNSRVQHPIADKAGKFYEVPLRDIIQSLPKEHQNTRDEISALGQHLENSTQIALTSEQIIELAKLIQPVDEEAIIKRVTENVALELRKIFLDAGTPDKQ